jgi:hypothetical protein
MKHEGMTMSQIAQQTSIGRGLQQTSKIIFMAIKLNNSLLEKSQLQCLFNLAFLRLSYTVPVI